MSDEAATDNRAAEDNIPGQERRGVVGIASSAARSPAAASSTAARNTGASSPLPRPPLAHPPLRLIVVSSSSLTTYFPFVKEKMEKN
jgi:hypothetical protein